MTVDELKTILEFVRKERNEYAILVLNLERRVAILQEQLEGSVETATALEEERNDLQLELNEK